MARFRYKTLTVGGDDATGELEAPDRAAALRELASRGTYITELAEFDGRGVRGLVAPAGTKGLRIRPKPLAALTRQLAVSLEAGLPLIEALDVVGREIEHAASRALICELSTRVQQGASLSDALEDHPETFSPLYTRLIRVAETGGVLDEVMTQLADVLERQTEMRERVKTASIYPAILLALGTLSVVIIVTFIVPMIVESIGGETIVLPWPTRVLLGVSDFVAGYWWLLLLVLGGGIVAWQQYVLNGPGRPWWDATQLRTPILGRLIRQLEASRFARSMGILARGGVTITQALAVVRDTMQNHQVREAIGKLADSVQSGGTIAGPLGRSGLFPPLLVQMVRVGENTGRLDEMLLRAASVHETEAKLTLDRLVGILPVVMILVLAVVIGFIVAGLVLAIIEFQTAGAGLAA